MIRHPLLPVAACLAGLSAAMPGARAQVPEPPLVEQSDAVRARYGDVPVTLRSPYFEGGPRRFAPGEEAAGFTTQAQMEEFLRGLGNAANMGSGSLGRSQQGRDIPYLVFSAEGARSLEEAARGRPAGRPVIWMVGQHHGNEPAGGEAMLALARELATGGELAPLVERVTVVVVPRSNPDGAAAFTRDTAARADPNRDHVLLSMPEARALHAGAAILPPDLVFDAHEFTVGGRWVAKFGALHAADFVFMRATHPLVPPPVTALADEVFLPAIEASAASAGLTSFVYQTAPNERPEDRTVATGGNAAGIARNAFGLTGAVSILLETRGIGLGAGSFQRRVASHVLAVATVLRAAAENAERLTRTVAEGRRWAAENDAPLVVAHRIPVVPGFVPLIDARTGAPRPTAVPFLDARRIEPTVVRPRPVGYVLAGGEATAPLRGILRLRGVRSCEIPAAAALAGAERFTVTARAEVDRRSINPEGGTTVRADRVVNRAELPAGSVFVPLAQPMAGLVVASLDPDAAGGFVATGVLPGEVGATLPLLRLPQGTAAPCSG